MEGDYRESDFCIAGRLHISVHRGCHGIQKNRASSSQRSSQRGEGKWLEWFGQLLFNICSALCFTLTFDYPEMLSSFHVFKNFQLVVFCFAFILSCLLFLMCEYFCVHKCSHVCRCIHMCAYQRMISYLIALYIEVTSLSSI